MDDKKPSYYCVTPASVMFDNTISDGSKTLYGVISALTNIEGYCWANNRYFCNLFKVTVREIQKRLSELKEKGHIKIEVYVSDGDRKIWITHPVNSNSPPMNSCSPPHEQAFIPPHEQAFIHNNTSINNLNYNIIALNSKKILFDAENNKLLGYDAYLSKWESAYPAIDINYQISRMETWLMEHPKNRKSNYLRFMGNWLRKAQDSALPIKKKESFPL